MGEPMIQNAMISDTDVPPQHSIYSTWTDHELVTHYTSGDHGAFQEIVNRNRHALMTVARRYANSEEDAHDILQDAWLKASRNLHRFRNESALSTWLYRVVKNCCYDFAHHKNRREQPTLDNNEISEDCNQHLSHDPSEQIDSAILLREALKTLRPDQSAALVLIDVAGYNVAQAAEIQGVAPGTIKSRRGRAREALRAALGEV